MTDNVYTVLFLCTGNSARSLMAEAAINHDGGGRFGGFSAGSHPSGKVHPLAVATLREAGLVTDGLRSKSWDEFATAGAPAMDFVVTVCDAVAGEVCPVWPGQPVTAHWGVENPAAASGSEAERLEVFRRVFETLRSRIAAFTALPIATLDPVSLQSRVRDLRII